MVMESSSVILVDCVDFDVLIQFADVSYVKCFLSVYFGLFNLVTAIYVENTLTPSVETFYLKPFSGISGGLLR